MAFLDPENFQEVLHARVMVNLGQYCCNGFQIDRFLVADDKPNDTLINYSFIFEKQTVGSEMHFRITLYVGEALDYCSAEGHPLYLDLNAYRVLIIEDGDTRLSCFGLIKNSSDGGSYSTNLTFTPPEYLKHDRVSPEIINSFGTALLDSLSGNRIPPSQDLHMVRGKNITLLMDSHLEGKFSTEQGTVVVDLASECLQYGPREWPGTKDLVVTLAQLQSDVPSHVMLQISKLVKDSSTLQLPLSPMRLA